MNPATKRQNSWHLPESVQPATLIFAAAVVAVLYAGPDKTLWIDEYLHFAFGALNFAEALDVLEATTGAGVNWGQTGVYLLLDNFLLNVFGANILALRLPSILSAFAMILAGLYFLRVKGLRYSYQWLLLAAFLAQGSLLYFSGESRPYMPMASAAIALLTFYALPIERRRSVVGVLLGLWGFIWGALMHPYWLGFLIIAVGFGWWAYRTSMSETKSWRFFLRFLSPGWFGLGLALYAALALLTWKRGDSGFRTDPFEYTGSLMGSGQTLVSTHFETIFLPANLDLTILPVSIQWFNISRVLVIVILIGLPVLAVWHRKRLPALAFPVALMWIGIGSSVVLGLLSWTQSYWIVQRQWVGGMAIATLGLIWALGLIIQGSATGIYRNVPRIIAVVTCIVIVFNGIGSAVGLMGNWSNVSTVWGEFEFAGKSRGELVQETRNSGDWVRLANINIARGGAVWREVAEYYGVR